MIFQGQEMLETREFGFRPPTPVDFNRAADPKFRGIVQMYRDLIALRHNVAGKTGGLTGQSSTWMMATRPWPTTVGSTGVRATMCRSGKLLERASAESEYRPPARGAMACAV
jgi:hypothetical protein